MIKFKKGDIIARYVALSQRYMYRTILEVGCEIYRVTLGEYWPEVYDRNESNVFTISYIDETYVSAEDAMRARQFKQDMGDLLNE